MTVATVINALSPSIYWRLNEAFGETTILDASGNGKTGVLVNGILGVPGVVVAEADTGLATDGVNGASVIGNDIDLAFNGATGVTLGCVVLYDAFDAGSEVLFLRLQDFLTNNNFFIRTTWPSPKLRTSANHLGAETQSADYTLSTGDVHLVVLRASGTTVELFVDGAGPFVAFTKAVQPTGVGGYLEIGQANTCTTQHAFFIPSAISDGDIADIWDAVIAPGTFAEEVTADSPTVWWDTRQASGVSQPDRSGNGHTGTITGSPTLDADGLTFDNTPTGDDEYVTSDTTWTAGTVWSELAIEVVVRVTAWGLASIITFDDFPSEQDYTGLASSVTGYLAPNPSAVGHPGISMGGDPPSSSLVHIVFEFETDGTYTLWVDGINEGSLSGALDALWPNAATLVLANDLCACGDGFTGLIRHGIFYDHSLGAARIAAHYAALGNDPPDLPTTPTVTNVSPSDGDIAGGTSVVITGTALTGATDVDFGATPAASFVVDNANQITAVSPAHAAGTVDITVTTPDGTSATGVDDEFTFTVLPIVSTVNPSSGPTAGGNSVVLAGSNFTGTTDVDFGATPAASYAVDNDEQITAVAPAHAAGTVQVVVTTPEGSSG